MTKYQELEIELIREGEKLVEKFKKEAKQGDFVKLGNVYGILEVGSKSGALLMRPIEYYKGMTNAIILDRTNIPRLVNFGNDFSEIAKFFRSEAAITSARYSEEIPF